MSNFTALDIKRAEESLAPTTAYAPEKNLVSFELSLRDTKQRANITEILVRDWLKNELGLDAELTGGREGGGFEAYDIECKLPSRGKLKTVRIECKSSLTCSYIWKRDGGIRFKFVGVKPKKFDYIFMFQVHPHDGLVVKRTTQKRIEQYIKSKSFTRQSHGFCITFADINNVEGLELYDLEDFPNEV